jgi:hypothetical protein
MTLPTRIRTVRGWAAPEARQPPRSIWSPTTLPSDHQTDHPGPVRRLPAFHPADGLDSHPAPRLGTATQAARTCPGRQGLLLQSQPCSPARTQDPDGHTIKEDHKANRLKRGSSGGRPPNFDAERYRERNTVERCIDKLRQLRAVPTRFDKREVIHQGTIDVASSKIWLRDPAS